VISDLGGKKNMLGGFYWMLAIFRNMDVEIPMVEAHFQSRFDHLLFHLEFN
jgi:hypothetical protein